MSAQRISYRHEGVRFVDLGPAYAAAASPIGRMSAAWGNLGDEDNSCAVGAGPIERRKATPAELARLDAGEPEISIAARTIAVDMLAAGRRGAEATRRKFRAVRP